VVVPLSAGSPPMRMDAATVARGISLGGAVGVMDGGYEVESP
jgi:hypothetical protein